MRLIDLPRTTSFRLALLFVVLFGLASLTLFGFLYCQTKGFLIESTDAWLRREMQGTANLDSLERMHRLNTHAAFDPELERPFAVFAADGTRLAGSPIPVPPGTVPLDRPFDFTIEDGARKLRLRSIGHRLTSGDLIVVAQDMHDVREFNEVLVNAILWGGIVTAGLGLAGAAIIGAGAVRRIDAVTLAIQRIVTGDLSGRLPGRGTSDDLDRLVHVVNGMLDDIERLMHEVKGVSDNIAHDLRTPLTRMLAGLERARRRASTAEEYAEAVEEAIIEMKGVLKTFTAMLRISEVEDGARRSGFTIVNLSQVVADATDFYEPLAEAKRLTLSVASEGGPACEMPGDPSLLFEAIGNLLDNAIKFTPEDGRVVVRTFRTDDGLGVSVSDTGPGIPPEEREAVLRRFHRTEKSRHTPGNGLGLSLVAAIARLHGMHLAIGEATPGCCVTLLHRPAENVSQSASVGGRG
jgi:signal transduction histidine kinase